VLNAILANYLLQIPTLNELAANPESLDQFVEKIVAALHQAISETTPRKRACPHSKRWWKPELTTLRKEAHRLRNKVRRTHLTLHERKKIEAEWKVTNARYIKAIAKAKQDTWRKFVENTVNIWTANRYLNNTPSQMFVPTIENAQTQHEKATKLQDAFFPAPPDAILEDIREAQYPTSVPFLPLITKQQIEKAVKNCSPRKAPGPDEISNRVLRETLPTISDHLLAMMQASLSSAHFPTPFKHTTTVVLRKPGKPDYTKPKAYRPIALENTLGKIMESVMTNIISYLTEEYNLLPARHYGGRPGRSTEDAMMELSENIYEAWKHKNVYSAIFLDVAGAFNNVIHQRLIYNLRKRRIPVEIAKWINSFLQGRTTQLVFNGSTSPSKPTAAGVPQGSPLSPLLYIYYNADLLDISEPQDANTSSTAIGFIDDIVFGVEGETDTANARTLESMLEEATKWKTRHGSVFEPSKYVLVHFTKNPHKRTAATITTDGTTIAPSNEARYLGVIFDQKLTFTSHLNYITKKGTAAAMALSGIAKCNWGATHKDIRQIFSTAIASKTDYAACIWHRPRKIGSAQATQNKKLTTIQRHAMKAITGCYTTTPTSALEIEANLEPPWIRLQTKVLSAVTRMQTLPANHPIHHWIAQAWCTRTANTIHRSNLQNVMHQFHGVISYQIETILPFVRPPWWKLEAEVMIPSSKESAKNKHQQIPMPSLNGATTWIYTDGSGIEGKIGAAAHCTNPIAATLYRHLGSDQQYNVYAAEITAFLLALQIPKQQTNEMKQCNIYSDSQAAIKALANPRMQSGQAIIKDTLDAIDQLLQCKVKLTITWIPGHEEIQGNEKADEAAKKAAKDPQINGLNTSTTWKYTHRPLKSAQKMKIKALASATWKQQWMKETKTANHLRHLATHPKFQTGTKYYRSAPTRKTATTLAQLRTGHCGLKQYLHRFKKAPSPYCQCQYQKETVEHYLMECRTYKNERDVLRKAVGNGKMRMKTLLGDARYIEHVMKYVERTKRFE